MQQKHTCTCRYRTPDAERSNDKYSHKNISTDLMQSACGKYWSRHCVWLLLTSNIYRVVAHCEKIWTIMKAGIRHSKWGRNLKIEENQAILHIACIFTSTCNISKTCHKIWKHQKLFCEDEINLEGMKL